MNRRSLLLASCLVVPAVVSARPERDAVRRALFAAALRGDEKSVEALIARGADPNAHDEKGETALMQAAGAGHYATVQCLLRHDARKDTRDDRGRTAFDHALARSHADIVALLRDAS